MKCNNCGNENVTGSFCEVCGTEMVAEPIVAEAEVIKTEVIAEAENVVETESIVEDVPAVDPGKTLGTVSMILGIASIVLGSICSCAFACLGGIAPAIMAVVGAVLGILAMNKSKAAGFKNKSALIGVILSAAAIVIVVLFVVINAVAGSVIGAITSSYYY